MKGLEIEEETSIHQQLLQPIDQEFLQKMQFDYEVLDEDTAKQALSYALQVRKMNRRIEASRKEIVKPHIDFQKAVMKFSCDLAQAMQEIEQNLQKKVVAWLIDQKDSPFTAVDELVVEDGKISLKTSWEFEIENEKEIPREFMIADHAEIQNAIKRGVRSIPGVSIFSKEKAELRIKN